MGVFFACGLLPVKDGKMVMGLVHQDGRAVCARTICGVRSLSRELECDRTHVYEYCAGDEHMSLAWEHPDLVKLGLNGKPSFVVSVEGLKLLLRGIKCFLKPIRSRRSTRKP